MGKHRLIGVLGVIVGLASACLIGAGGSFNLPDSNGFVYQCIDVVSGSARYIDPSIGDAANTCTANEREIRFQAEIVSPTTTTSTTSTTSTTVPPTTTTTVPPTTTTTTAPPPPSDFPTAASTGADETVPLQTVSSDMTITTPGALVMNKRFVNGANLWVMASNVDVQNVVFEGGRLNNHDMSNKIVHNGMMVSHVTFTNIPGQRHNTTPEHIYYRLGDGGYTADHIRIDKQQEGFRLGGADHGGTDATITDSFVLIDTYGDVRWNGSSWVADEGTNHVNFSSPSSPDNAPCDGHPDGVQGYVGPHAHIEHNTFDEAHYGPGTCNDAPLFIADDSLGAEVINNAFLGGGYSERLHAGHYTSRNNRIAHNQWGYGPIACGGESSFVLDAESGDMTADLDANYHVTATHLNVHC